jgi:hypothetical protein
MPESITVTVLGPESGLIRYHVSALTAGSCISPRRNVADCPPTVTLRAVIVVVLMDMPIIMNLLAPEPTT